MHTDAVRDLLRHPSRRSACHVLLTSVARRLDEQACTLLVSQRTWAVNGAGRLVTRDYQRHWMRVLQGGAEDSS